jgi:superfamily II DNA or RNA helicase
MVKIVKINESYIRIFCEFDLSKEIYNYFAFFTKNYKWSPKYKAGVWDGKIRLFQYKNGLLPIGLYDDLVNFLVRKGIKFSNEVEQPSGLNFSDDFIKKFTKEILKCDLVPRDYQIKSVQEVLKKQKTIILSATGSGKSMSIFIWINLLKYAYDDCKFLLVVPTTSLVEQMTEDFVEYGKNFCDYNDHIHTIYSGKEKNTDKNITISTWQSLQHIKQKRWFDQFGCVTIDETHGATAKQLTSIVQKCESAVFKIGTTGSLTDNETDKMQLKSLFGNIFSASTTKNLQKRNILSKLKIRNCVLDYPQKYRNLCKKFDFMTELDFVRDSKERKQFILKLVNRLSGNRLVLFKNIEYGRSLYEKIKEKNPNAYFIYGGTKTIERELVRAIADGHALKFEFDKFNITIHQNDIVILNDGNTKKAKNITINDVIDNKWISKRIDVKKIENFDNKPKKIIHVGDNSDIIIVASFGVFSTGINIKNLPNLIFAESMKSSIKVIQSIGRILRLHTSKKCAILYDICDDLTYKKRKNYLLKHFFARIKIYDEQGFNYTTKKVKI